MPGRFTPIQQRLMRVIMLTCGVLLVLTFAALFLYEYLSYRNIARSELRQLAQVIAANTTSSLAFDAPEDAAQVLSSLRSQKDVVAARLYRANGTAFADYGQASGLPAKDPSVTGFWFRNRYLEGYYPVVENNRRLGTLYLRVNLQVMYNRLALYAIFALLTIGIALLLAFIFSGRLRKSLSQPILDLAATAAAVSDQKNYALRATFYNNDEVGELTNAFNAMLTQIEAQNDEISSLNLGLERKVEERTGQLQESNRSLREQKDFTEAILDASIDLIAVFDKELRYRMVNNTAISRFGKTKADLLGQRMDEVFPNMAKSRVEQLLRRALAGEFIRDDAYQSQLSDRVLQNFYIPLYDADGKVDRVLLLGHDITDVMRTQVQLQALNADLEKSNRDLEQFAYVASHDLQEPLRKIQTFADLSQRNLQHPQILERYLDKIASSAERMSNLIRDVLNFSRLTRDQNEQPVPVDLNTVLAGIRVDLELLVEEKGAVINADELPTVPGQPRQLGQLFQNLLGNALKFSERPPRIHIGVRYVDGPLELRGVRLRSAHRFAELSFSDNGIGFDPQYVDKIFSIFQRLHTSSEYAGTGIGLALCKKIVENHGGAISVESKPGEGTTFYVYLPLDAPEAKRIKAEKAEGAGGIAGTIV
ncbi:ATP-binding protein [Flaviaesturariibacter terrae]